MSRHPGQGGLEFQTMTDSIPAIYSRPPKKELISPTKRIMAGLTALSALAVLLMAIWITPNPRGTETHRQLGLAPCHFKSQFNIPCLTCGMTTSFSWFVRGNLIASFYVQPMGMILAGFTFFLFWFSAFEAATGKNLHVLLQILPLNSYLLCSAGLSIAAWVWKIVLHLTHHDGWIG